MAIVPFPRSQSTPTLSCKLVASLDARSAMLRVIAKLQLLVMRNPRAAIVAIGILDGLLEE
jgi:hypothetical protein